MTWALVLQLTCALPDGGTLNRFELTFAKPAVPRPAPVLEDRHRRLRDAVQRSMAKAPFLVTKALGDQLLATAERYGRTGIAYDEPAGRVERNEHAPAVNAGQNALIQVKRLRGDPVFEPSIDEALAGGARVQEFADGEGAPELSPEVEITQSTVRLVKASKSGQIDSWVLENARAVVREPGRTVWRFDCRIVFRKRLTGETAASMAPSVALSLLSTGRVPLVAGRFDEVSGTIDVIDLTQPRVQCRATLLEIDDSEG